MDWTSPFSLAGYWYKGNLHTHTTESDGQRPPEEAIRWYRENGYDFLAISDHWVLDKGKPLDHDFVTVSATELNGKGYHLLAVGADSLPPRELEDDPQAVIDHVKSQGGLAYIAHPYWTGRPSLETAALENLDGLEVYNSVCEIEAGLGHARVHWDDCLTAGRRLNGLAVDDVHWRYGAQGGGYIMVRSPKLTETALIDAIRAGNFYASMGPTIQDLRITQSSTNPVLCIQCSPCKEIVFYTAGPRGHRFEAAPGTSLGQGCLPLSADQVFVRVECRDAQGRCAWTNPIYVSDVL